MIKYLVTALIVSNFGSALADVPNLFVSEAAKIECGQPSTSSVAGLSDSDLAAMFKHQNIKLVNTVERRFQNMFYVEFAKFPKSLHNELITQGATINLMQGEGVTIDPSWPKIENTFDGRSWDKVPGSGGSPGNAPTRIVANHLYDRHGSTNLFLHEHAHTLDQLYKENGISKSKTWLQLLVNHSEATTFLTEICGSYCTDNINEGFAEFFAYYHACDDSKARVKEKLPEFADFFDQLTDVKAFRKKDRAK